jgi:hypothetical protein
VRLLDGHVLSGLALPVFGKGGVELHIQLARRVVRHIQQGHGRRLGQRAGAAQGQSGGGGGSQGKLDKVAAKAHEGLVVYSFNI